jgi:hypothetical protein
MEMKKIFSWLLVGLLIGSVNLLEAVCTVCGCTGQMVNQYSTSGTSKLVCGVVIRDKGTGAILNDPANPKSNNGLKCTKCTCSTGRISDHNYALKDGLPCGTPALEQMTDASCDVSTGLIAAASCNG